MAWQARRGSRGGAGTPERVQAGEGPRADVAQHIGVVRLPLAVVALADDDGRDGIERTMQDAAAAVVEVARVLLEYRRKDGRAEEGGAEVVSVSGCIAAGVTRDSRAVAGEVALRLLDARGDGGGAEGDGIAADNQRQLELLAACEWRS